MQKKDEVKLYVGICKENSKLILALCPMLSAQLYGDGLVRSPHCCHCEERSDAAISIFQADTNYESGAPSGRSRRLP
jgi:hypothetical protein